MTELAANGARALPTNAPLPDETSVQALHHLPWRALDQLVESQTWLDPIADRLHKLTDRALTPGPAGTALRDLLDGTVLGHPLHAALTDLPMGAWTAGLILDLLSAQPCYAELAPGADAALGIGLAGALAAAVAGLADWNYTEGRIRRVGMAHALNNAVATALYGTSLAARLRGKRRLGRRLSYAGLGVIFIGAYLGGVLAYRFGIGVDHAAFERGADHFVDVLADADLPEAAMRGAKANGVAILLARRNGEVYAIGNTCTHLGCLLSEGHLTGDVVTCKCHESQFLVTTGTVVRGPADYDERRYDVRVHQGRIQVRARQA